MGNERIIQENESIQTSYLLCNYKLSMKRLLSFLLMAMCLCNIVLFSQNQKTTMELLMSTKWEPQNAYEEGDAGYVKYSKDKLLYFENIDNEVDSVHWDYYLSSTPDTVFDKTKVGKNTTGKYIIRKGPDVVFIDEILELTSSKFVIRKSTPGYSTYGHKVTYLPTDMSF